MKSLLKIAVVAIMAVSLTGCIQFPWSQEEIDARVIAIQEIVKESCSFLPTANSVAAILAAGNPAVAGVTSVAQAICDAVGGGETKSAPSEEPKKQCFGVLNGVCIEGKRV